MQHTLTVLDHGLEFIGAHLAADFVNTSSFRYDKARAHEHIQTYADLVEFARQAGEISGSVARRLIADAEARPEKAAQVYRRAVALREATFAALSRLAHDKEPPREAVETISAEAADAQAHARLVKTEAGWRWQWPLEEDMARPLWPIARAAADLLTSDEDRRLVRECADETCAWMFVDRTKNHSRRWCKENTCGSRSKVRAFRQRQKRAARAR
jgi:predicted RNA-binding Zn ribbon-like protein